MRRFVSQFESDARINARRQHGLAQRARPAITARARLATPARRCRWRRHRGGGGDRPGRRRRAAGLHPRPRRRQGESMPENQVALRGGPCGGGRAVGGCRPPRRGPHPRGRPGADPTTRTYRVRVAFVDADFGPASARPRASTSATRRRATRRATGRAARKDGKPALWRVDPASRRVHLVEVELLRYEEDGVLLGSGIDAGAWVVTAGVHRLRDRRRSTPTTDRSPSERFPAPRVASSLPPGRRRAEYPLRTRPCIPSTFPPGPCATPSCSTRSSCSARSACGRTAASARPGPPFTFKVMVVQTLWPARPLEFRRSPDDREEAAGAAQATTCAASRPASRRCSSSSGLDQNLVPDIWYRCKRSVASVACCRPTCTGRSSTTSSATQANICADRRGFDRRPARLWQVTRTLRVPGGADRALPPG